MVKKTHIVRVLRDVSNEWFHWAILDIALLIMDNVCLQLFVPLPPSSFAMHISALDSAALKAALFSFPGVTLSIWK